MSLHVVDIQRFALHDGPGIRTTVFLQGCPLRCPWCANPESQHVGTHLMYLQKRCIGCGHCASICPSGCVTLGEDGLVFHRELCIVCGRCVAQCPSGALRFSGKVMESGDIVALLLRDQSYYRHTDGGVTISGGEPFLQAGGLRELLTLCKDHGLHTAVETTGHVPSEHMMPCVPLVDLFLYDLKHIDPHLFAQITRGDLFLVLANLALLPPEKVTLRIPVIPSFNDDPQTLRQMFELALQRGIRRVDLLPYHNLGQGKYAQLGLPYPFEGRSPLTQKDLESFQALGKSLGLLMG